MRLSAAIRGRINFKHQGLLVGISPDVAQTPRSMGRTHPALMGISDMLPLLNCPAFRFLVGVGGIIKPGSLGRFAGWDGDPYQTMRQLWGRPLPWRAPLCSCPTRTSGPINKEARPTRGLAGGNQGRGAKPPSKEGGRAAGAEGRVDETSIAARRRETRGAAEQNIARTPMRCLSGSSDRDVDAEGLDDAVAAAGVYNEGVVAL